MPCTDNLWGIPCQRPASNPLGKHEDNASKTIKTHSHKDRGSDRPLSTQPLPWSHGTINQFQWTLTEPEHHKEIGEVEEGDHHKEVWLGQMMPEPKEGYRVHASLVESKDISLTIVPWSRNEPITGQPNSSTGVRKTMRVIQGQQQLTPCINNWICYQKTTKRSWWQGWGLRKEIFQKPNPCSLD